MSTTQDEVDVAALVRGTIERYSLLTHGQTVVVAVSGGPDSTALLHLLATLGDAWGMTVIAAHLNHSFRGPEADGDAEFVVALCQELAVTCVLTKVDVPAAARRRHVSAQQAARDVRHAFLRRVAADHGAARIALGHTRDDRVETILMNLLRGTGPEGLAGFPVSDLPLVRPLFAITRAQVTAYCQQYRLNPRHDSSNAKTDYLRNRTRAELLPYLRSYYNEKADFALIRMAELIAADNDVLEEMSATFLAEAGRSDIERSDGKNEVVLDQNRFIILPVALQRRVLRQMIARVRGNLSGVTFDTIQGAIDAITSGGRYMVTLPATEIGSVRLECDSGKFRVYRELPQACAVPWAAPLAIPGDTRLVRAGIGIEAVLCANAFELESLLSATYTRDRVTYGNIQGLVFRIADVALPVVARSWRPGDRIQLRGNAGSKKLQDLFVDGKIPIEQRASLAVIVAGDGMIQAVIGVAAADAALQPAEWRVWTAIESEVIDGGKVEAAGGLLVMIPYRLSIDTIEPVQVLPLQTEK